MRMKASWVLAAAGAGMVASAAMADFSRDVTITATYQTPGGPVQHQVPLNLDTDFAWTHTDASGTDWFDYNGPAQYFGGDVNADAVFNDMQIGIRQDPAVVANFNVAAGIFNTTFTVTSSLVSFPTIVNGQAIASAAISVTDSATFGDVGSVSLTGLQPGANAFSAIFNNGGSPFTFADLIPGGVFAPGAGGTHVYVGQSASFPAYDAVPGSVTTIQSQFAFSLSRFDRAAGTSTFEIIPAPGAAALLALGGLSLSRRRRVG